jgi:hypothetical protein
VDYFAKVIVWLNGIMSTSETSSVQILPEFKFLRENVAVMRKFDSYCSACVLIEKWGHFLLFDGRGPLFI